MAEDLIYLGKVKFVSEKFVIIEPILFSDPSKKRWDGTIPSAQRRYSFPDNGVVFWFKPHTPTAPQKDSYWEFEIDEHPEYQQKPTNRDKFQVRIHSEPYYRESIEVIDLRHAGSARDIREGLTSKEGFPLRIAPVMRTAMLWIEEALWLGPIKPIKCTDTGRWRVEGRKGDEDFSAIDALVPDSENFRSVQCDGTRHILPPGGNIGTKIGIRNWEPDEQLAKRLLKRIGKLDPELLKALEVTKKTFDGYISILSRKETGLFGADLEQELARKERILELKDIIERNIPIAEEAVRIFCSSEHFKKTLEQEKAEIREPIRIEVTRKTEDELKGKRADIEGIGKKISEKKVELTLVDKKLKQHKDDLDKKAGAYDVEFSKKLRALAERPDVLFPELAVFRHALSSGGGDTVDGTLPLCLVEDVRKTTTVVPDIVRDKEQLLKLMTTAFNKNGFSPFLGNRLLSGFLSGLVPVVAGDRAYESIEIFARHVSGARLLWVPVSGSLYEPHDLFGVTDRSGKFIPHPAGLLGAIHNAHESPDTLFIVVLDGFNRAPIDSYLLPLLQCKLDCHVGGGTRFLPLHSSLVRDGENPGVISARLFWPNNVLIALTPSGDGSFATSREFWRYALLLDTKQGPIFPSDDESKHPDNMPTTGSVSEVPRSVLGAWIEEARSKSLTDTTPWLSEAEKAMGIRIREESLRFYAACLASDMEAPDAKKQVFLSSVLPRISAAETDTNTVLGKCGLAVDGDTDNVISLIRQLGG